MLAMVTSCSKKVDKASDEKTLEIALNGDGTATSFADLVNPVEFVTIEATDSCLLKQVSKVVETENAYYLMDPSGIHPLVKTTKDGKFIKQIGDKGNGPGEYLALFDIAVPSGGKVYACTSPSLVAEYDNEGNFVRQTHVSDTVALMSLVPVNHTILMGGKYNTPNSNQLVAFSEDFQQKGAWCHVDNGFVPPLCELLKGDLTSGFYLDWYNNRIYIYDDEANEAHPFMNFTINNDAKSNNITSAMEFMSMQQELGFILNWGVNKSNVIVEYVINGEPNILVVDRENNEVRYNGKYDDYFPDMFISKTGNEFISIITVDNYEFYKNNLPQNCGMPDFDDENTNVILMKWSVKK